MVTQPDEQFSFAHRLNDDGTFDSICPRCFATVAVKRNETELDSEERRHVCNPRVAERYRELSEAVAAYRKGRRD